MIRKIDIKNYGSFKNFEWSLNLGNEKFGKFNILYGRNGSGKTTFSRLLRSFELKNHFLDFENPNYKIELESNLSLMQSDVENNTLKIKVFNQDFIKEKLSIFHDENGDIISFRVGESIELQRELALLDTRITEEKIKFYGNLENKIIGISEEFEKKEKEIQKMEKDTNNSLTYRASSIKMSEILFKMTPQKRTYDKNDLLSEIPFAKQLSEDENRKNIILVSQNELGMLDTIQTEIFDFDFKEMINRIKNLIFLEIKPSVVIERFNTLPEIRIWAEKGKELHKEKNEVVLV